MKVRPVIFQFRSRTKFTTGTWPGGRAAKAAVCKTVGQHAHSRVRIPPRSFVVKRRTNRPVGLAPTAIRMGPHRPVDRAHRPPLDLEGVSGGGPAPLSKSGESLGTGVRFLRLPLD